MTTSLKARFRKFIKTWDGFEDVDTLLKKAHSVGKQRGDYLLDRRKVIVEEKAIEADRKRPSCKVFRSAP
jgi:hypothetical protein